MAKRPDRSFDYVAIINHRPVHHRPSCHGERERENMEDSCDDDEKRIEFQYMTAALYSSPCTGLFKLPL